ncbi:MAG: protein kinase [Lachnospiraceae bacterium]|nr:protein kinase [Lachnospiraceae bacterium]
MLETFHLHKDWKLVSVLRCTNDHVVLSLKNIQNGVPEIAKVISKRKFDNRVHHILSHLSDSNLLTEKRMRSSHSWVMIHYPMLNPLRDYVHDQGMTLSEILYLAENISEAVTSLHEHNLLHLDISPDNIFQDDDGNFLLGDFSNTRRADKKGSLTTITPYYTAPECKEGNPSFASDQYSLAMLLFVLLHDGSVPESEHGDLSRFLSRQQKKHTATDVQHPIDDVHPMGTPYPAVLYTHFEKALSPEPSARYPDVTSFVSDIQSCLKPLCEDSDYRLQPVDRDHPFYQIHTIEISPRHNFHFPTLLPEKVQAKKIYASLGLASLIMSLLFGKILSSQIHMSQNRNVKTATTSFSDHAEVTASANHPDSEHPEDLRERDNEPFCNVLDISNKQANTLAELLREEDISSGWNILYGENNAFSSLEELAEFPHIQELYLSGNRITSLQALCSLSELQTLILSDNCCTDLMPISSLPRLTVLDLSGNRDLSQVDCLQQLQDLRLLILTDTSVPLISIQTLQAAIPDCEIVY